MLGSKKLERETGFEPATSTLARSHSTTELLPPVPSFYCTCAFRDNLLHPHWHALIVILLFHIGCSPAIRGGTLDELNLSLPRPAAIVGVVHRHVNVRLAKHNRRNPRTRGSTKVLLTRCVQRHILCARVPAISIVAVKRHSPRLKPEFNSGIST